MQSAVSAVKLMASKERIVRFNPPKKTTPYSYIF